MNVKDNHRGAVSTLVRSLFAVKYRDGTRTYGLSSAVTKTYRHEKPIKLLNGAECENAYFSYSKGDNAYTLLQPQ